MQVLVRRILMMSCRCEANMKDLSYVNVNGIIYKKELQRQIESEEQKQKERLRKKKLKMIMKLMIDI